MDNYFLLPQPPSLCYLATGKAVDYLPNDEIPNRDELIESLRAKLRALFPDAAPDAEEKRAEVLAYAAEEALGPPGLRDVAAAADLPLADIEKLWRAVDGIADAH